jgi:uncharacterized protein (DUF305 family)
MNHSKSMSKIAATLLTLALGGCFLVGCTTSPGAPTMGSTTMAGHAESMKMGTSGIEALKTLKAKEFDIAFLSQMISHHQAALQMARQAVAVSSKPATKENAQKVMLAQTAEIAQMTQWLKEWYQSEPSKSQQTLVLEDMKSMTAMPVTNDQSFYEMMIPHHQGAIDMSNLVKGRTENKKVEALADQIINDQTSEIAKYRGVLK